MDTVEQTNYSKSNKPLHEMSEQEMVSLNNTWFERVVDNRRHIERDTLLNISFLLDHHYLQLSTVGKSVQLVPTPEKKNRVRTVEQIIEPAVRSEMSRLLRTKPRGVVIPQGDDPEDYESAEAADAGLAYVLQAHGVEEYQEQAALWMLTGGTAHMNVFWDAMKVDEYGNQGDYDFRTLSPFEFGVPSNRRWRLQDQPYIMVTKAYELDEILEKWNQEVEPNRDEKFASLDDRLASIIQTSTSQNIRGKSSEDNKVPVAIVKETWIKPGRMAPDGAVLITCNDKILDLKVWPEWCHRKYPFYKHIYTQISGAYWGKAMVTSLVPLQRRHNRAASIVIETMNTLAQTRIGVPRNTQIKGALGGKVVMFETPLGSPQGVSNITAPPIGDLPFRELDNTRMAVRDISHQHEVSRGTTPPNVRSGSAINALKELDDTASVIPVRSIERGSQDMGRHIIAIMKEMWDEPRLIYVLGETGDIERRSFIAGNEVNGQYVIQAGSTYSYSKEQRQQMVLRNLEHGLISPEEALSYQDMGTSRGILKERDITKRHARRENQKFIDMSPINPQTGEPDIAYLQEQFNQLLPADWHDHVAHIQEHNKLRMNPTYENWPTWKRALFESHIAGHETALMAQMEAAQGVGQPRPMEDQRQPQQEG